MSQLLEYIFGVLKADGNIFSAIREERPIKEAISSFILTIIVCLLISLPISYFKYKAILTASLDNTILAIFKTQTFAQYLAQNTSTLLWPAIILLICWLFFSGLFHLLAKGFGTQTDFITFLSFTGFLLPFEILFCLDFLIFYLGGYVQSAAVIFSSFILGAILFIWFARSLILGASEIYEFEKSKAAAIFFIILLLIIAVLVGGWYLIHP